MDRTPKPDHHPKLPDFDDLEEAIDEMNAELVAILRDNPEDFQAALVVHLDALFEAIDQTKA